MFTKESKLFISHGLILYFHLIKNLTAVLHCSFVKVKLVTTVYDSQWG